VQDFVYNEGMAGKERINIYIDGGNFHHLVLKKLGIDELDFEFDKFADFLAEDRKIVDMGKRFYIGTVREKIGDAQSKEAMARQTKLFTNLRLGDWEIKTSKLRMRTEKIIIDKRVADYKKIIQAGIQEINVNRMREKGIDVKLATDLIVGAIDNKYDTAVIVSSDTDLAPSIDWIRLRLKKKVEYVGFSINSLKIPQEKSTPSQGMITHSDIQRILVESDVKKFVKQKLF
jgi:uncharacterized LabA/DUF88 family protein